MATTCMSVKIGVLSLQGAFREHITLLKTIPGVVPVEVRTAVELCSVSGLILPGGESTTIASVAQRWGLLEPLMQFAKAGKPIWGTCAGLILLAEKAEGMKQGGQALIGGLDVVVTRNFFGAQVESFENEMEAPACLSSFGSQPFRGVFIRAPAILEVGVGVEVLCSLELDGQQKQRSQRDHVIVAVRSKSCLATAFHPELTGDNRWHQLFVSMVLEDVQDGSAISSAVSQEMLKSKVPLDLPVYGKHHMVLSPSPYETSI